RFFNNRLEGRIDVFQKKSTDLLAFFPLSLTLGTPTVNKNVADLKTNGFEFTLTSRNIKGVFEWNTQLGISHAKTIVTKLYNKIYLTSGLTGSGLFHSEGMIAYGLAS